MIFKTIIFFEINLKEFNLIFNDILVFYGLNYERIDKNTKKVIKTKWNRELLSDNERKFWSFWGQISNTRILMKKLFYEKSFQINLVSVQRITFQQILNVLSFATKQIFSFCLYNLRFWQFFVWLMKMYFKLNSESNRFHNL